MQPDAAFDMVSDPAWPQPGGVDALFETIGAVGSAAFGDRLFRLLSDMLAVDEIFAFRREPDRAPHQLLACNHLHDAASRAALYCEALHRQDPVAPVLQRRPDRLHAVRVRPEQLDRSYRSIFFDRPRLVDKVGLCLPARGEWIVLNLYRTQANGRFAESDLDVLRWMGPLLARAVAEHALNQRAPTRSEQLLTKAEQLLARRGAGLTRRELEVCARASIGMTVEATALELGVSESSVLTYRKRAYRRLGISSAYELMALLLH